MPRIPVYEQQIVPSQGLSAPAARAPGGGNLLLLSKGVERMSDSLDRAAQIDMQAQRERMEEDAAIWSARVTSAYDARAQNHALEAQSTADPSGTGYHDDLLKWHESETSKLLESAPNRLARERAAAHFAGTRERLSAGAFAWQEGERRRALGDYIDRGTEDSARLVLANPSLASAELDKWGEAIGKMTLPANAKAQLLDLAKQKIAEATIAGQIERGTFKAAGSAWNVLPAGKQAQYLRSAEEKARADRSRFLADSMVSAVDAAVSTIPMGPNDIVDVPEQRAIAQREFEARIGTALDASEQAQFDNYFRARVADRERDQARSDLARRKSVFDALDQNEGNLTALVAQDGTIRTALSRESWDAVNTYADQVRSGAYVPTNPELFTLLDTSPQTLMQTDLEAVRHQLGSDARTYLAERKRKLLTDPGSMQSLFSTDEIVRQSMPESIVGDAEEEMRFKIAVEAQVRDELIATGKEKMSPDRIGQIAAGQARIVATRRGVFVDSPVRAYEIPDDERDTIKRALTKAGIEPSEQAIREAWRRNNAQGGAGGSW